MSEELCAVCREPLNHNRANCLDCGNDFHLALRVDVPARDCGEAWVDDEVQAVVFGCNLCLGHTAQAPSPRRRRRHTGVSASEVARARKRPRAKN